MHIVSAYIDLSLPYVHSLKGRRKILHSLKERLKHRNLSVLDISSEYPKEATLAICFLAPTKEDAHKKLQHIESLIHSTFPEIPFDLSYEII